MSNYIQLDNIPATANSLLNILWEQNRAMTLSELTKLYNQSTSKSWSQREIRHFLNLLIRFDYIESKRHGLALYYSALGSEYEL